jgi:7,8-dihydro-6-hydroxymethylpterin-pyrophosphokinase
MHIFLGLCSNLEDKDQQLVTARDLLMKHDILVLGQSEVRETEPLGGLDQPQYLNQVVECQTDLDPQELLLTCKKIERDMGRPDKAPNIGNVKIGSTSLAEVGELMSQRWESRIIDIDILFYGDQVIDEPNLQIPHYDAHVRHFEIEGMCDLAPGFVHPVLKKTMKELLDAA